MKKEEKIILFRIILSIILYCFLYFIHNEFLYFVIFFITYIIIGFDVIKNSLINIYNKEIFDENFLMLLASSGAFILKDYKESLAILLLYQMGEFFSHLAIKNSKKNIVDLMKLHPDYANIKKDNKILKVSPNSININDIIYVLPGEKIPLDGIVIDGSSSINTSILTGESVPVDVKKNDKVISGCLNISGLLTIKVTEKFSESTISKILKLIETADDKKSKSEDFIKRLAHYYTPFVCFCALFVAFIIPLCQLFLLNKTEFTSWFYKGVSFLIISCPCSLIISIPLAFFVGIGIASKYGIFIKGANFIEILSKVKTFIFDKTGTITKGVFEVCAIHKSPIQEKELLKIASYAEVYSTHPIANSIKKAYKEKIDLRQIKNIEEISGYGVIANINNDIIAVGNEKLMNKINVNFIPCNSIGTIVHVSKNNEYLGHIVISDIIRPSAQDIIKKLQKHNISVMMLTGDNKNIANSIAKKLNINKIYSELLPQDKLNILENEINKDKKLKIAFVGDGINDVLALKKADIGISLGEIGSEIAIDSADMVLINDDLTKIYQAIKISQTTLNKVYQNIFISLFVKVICMILSFFGIANMWLSIFADTGILIITIFNSIEPYLKFYFKKIIKHYFFKRICLI